MNTPMTPEQIEREMLRQEKAGQRECIASTEHDDPAIDQYRLINRALKQVKIPALPAGFATRVAMQIRDYEERAQFENSALAVTIVVAIIAGLFFTLVPLIQTMQNLFASTNLPWPMLVAAFFALGFAAMIDKLSTQHRMSTT